MVTDVLWLTPDKPANISVGRSRIADHLRRHRFEITVRGTTPGTVAWAFRNRSAFDVVVGTTRSGAIAGAALRLLCGMPLVVDHVDPIRQLAETARPSVVTATERLENLAFRLSESTLYVYAEEADRVERHARNTRRTSLGVDYDRFSNPDPDVIQRASERLGRYDTRGNLVVYIGGLEPMYRIPALLDAATRLPEWTLVVAGTGALESDVRVAHDGRSVVHLGTVPHEEVPGILHHADVGVSLVDDPHTLKVLEYGASGTAVVQLDGRARALLGDRVTYCSDDPEEVAAAIPQADEAGADSIRSFARRFDWARVAETYAEVLAAASGRGGQP